MEIPEVIRGIFGPVFSLQPAEALEMQALEQRSPEWLAARVNRLTASNFGSAAGLNPYCKPEDLLVQLLFKSFEGNEATAYGTKFESVACEQYVASIGDDIIYSRVLQNPLELPKWRDSGLSINPRWPFLGASPDGIMTTQAFSSIVPVNYRCAVAPEHGLQQTIFDPARGLVSMPVWSPPTENPHEYLLEIKCPFRKRLYGPIPPYYYAQIQGCMQILDLPYTHFYVWTPNKASIDCFPKNQGFWDSVLLPRLTAFYFDRFVPAVVMQSLELLDTSDRFGPNPDWLKPKDSVSPELVATIYEEARSFRAQCCF
jgi:putative phage-type endonuclease